MLLIIGQVRTCHLPLRWWQHFLLTKLKIPIQQQQLQRSIVLTVFRHGKSLNVTFICVSCGMAEQGNNLTSNLHALQYYSTETAEFAFFWCWNISLACQESNCATMLTCQLVICFSCIILACPMAKNCRVERL